MPNHLAPCGVTRAETPVASVLSERIAVPSNDSSSLEESGESEALR